GWSDIGSWSTVWEVLDHDAAGNAADGPVVILDSHNSLVRSEESVLTTVVGLDDVIVVSTADAVLVTSRAKAEQVKGLVEQLKTQNQRAAVEHRRIYRPWGYYQDVDLADRYPGLGFPFSCPWKGSVSLHPRDDGARTIGAAAIGRRFSN